MLEEQFNYSRTSSNLREKIRGSGAILQVPTTVSEAELAALLAVSEADWARLLAVSLVESIMEVSLVESLAESAREDVRRLINYLKSSSE
jgi:hypothetical protein